MTVEVEVGQFRESLARLKAAVGQVIVGQADIVEGAMVALFAGGHVLLEGVPGVGKTRLVRALSDALSLSFGRIQFTPDLMPSDVLGTNMIVEEGGHRRFQFQRGPVFSHVLLADEVNRATPKTQSALLEAMQEGSVTVAGVTHSLPSPFIVLATQNPLEMEGTYPLPEAQLDRFMFKLKVLSPSAAELGEILDRTTGERTPTVEPVLDQEGVLAARALVRRVPTPEVTKQMVVRAVELSHPGSSGAPPLVTRYVRYGASPRGAQALLVGAKLGALAAGRFAPSRDVVRKVGRAALRHRVLLNFEGEAEGIDPDRVIDEVLDAAAREK